MIIPANWLKKVLINLFLFFIISMKKNLALYLLYWTPLTQECIMLWPSFSGEEDYVKVGVVYLNIMVAFPTFKRYLQEGTKDKMKIKSSM